MSVQKHGLDYLKSYSGILNIAEQVLNLGTFVSGSICGYIPKTFPLNFATLLAILATAFFMVGHVKALFRKVDFPWHWIEFGTACTFTIIFAVSSSVVISEFIGAFIVTGVLGYTTAMVYLLDSIDKFHLAAIPRARYVWTTPNMPV
ncbi:hypothetical protein JTB14_010446 [Gonioctena quinquepunctata]|nr:hypothetical protein JTB14_010446 [Gonioctena quinquepunctata]